MIGSVPSGIGQANFSDWIDSIMRLTDIVGIDHVGIGTDMDANYAPVFSDYRQWGLIPAALLARGMSEAETAKAMGGQLYAAVSRRCWVTAAATVARSGRLTVRTYSRRWPVEK